MVGEKDGGVVDGRGVGVLVGEKEGGVVKGEGVGGCDDGLKVSGADEGIGVG